MGTRPCLYLALLAYSARFLGYVYIPNAWYAVAVEVTHLFTFALMFTAAMVYITEIAPGGTVATMIGLVNGLKWGLGKCLGKGIDRTEIPII